MGRTNAGTPMDADGWADVLVDIAKLQLDQAGGANDMNADSKGVTQEVTEYGFPLTINNLSEFTNNPAAITQIKNNLRLTPGLCHVSRVANYTFVSSTDTIIFDKVVDDAASTYNTTTGVFVAPVAGLYTISVFARFDFPATAANVRYNPKCYWELYKNSTFQYIAEYETDMTFGSASTGHDLKITLPLTLPLRLAQGDRITTAGASCLELISSNWGQLHRQSFFTATWIPQ
jgi:hypothetical protein